VRRFRAAYGEAPYGYLSRRRMETATFLLGNTDLGVREIARRLGFEDEHYFSTFYRKKTGKSPTGARGAGQAATRHAMGPAAPPIQ